MIVINVQAIPLVNTELEMAHLFGLRESANAKNVAKKKLQDLPSGKYYFSWAGMVIWVKTWRCCLFEGMQDLGLD